MISTLQLINSYIAGCHTVLSALWQLRMQDFWIRISLHKKNNNNNLNNNNNNNKNNNNDNNNNNNINNNNSNNKRNA